METLKDLRNLVDEATSHDYETCAKILIALIITTIQIGMMTADEVQESLLLMKEFNGSNAQNLAGMEVKGHG